MGFKTQQIVLQMDTWIKKNLEVKNFGLLKNNFVFGQQKYHRKNVPKFKQNFFKLQFYIINF